MGSRTSAGVCGRPLGAVLVGGRGGHPGKLWAGRWVGTLRWRQQALRTRRVCSGTAALVPVTERAWGGRGGSGLGRQAWEGVRPAPRGPSPVSRIWGPEGTSRSLSNSVYLFMEPRGGEQRRLMEAIEASRRLTSSRWRCSKDAVPMTLGPVIFLIRSAGQRVSEAFQILRD